jgi:hypothetical protein
LGAAVAEIAASASTPIVSIENRFIGSPLADLDASRAHGTAKAVESMGYEGLSPDLNSSISMP